MKKIKLIQIFFITVISLCFLSVSVVFSASYWDRMDYSPEGELFSCYFTDSNTGCISGKILSPGNPSEGFISKTSDAGNNWTQKYNNSQNEVIYDMDFSGSSNGWAVGANVMIDIGIILKTSDGGDTWTHAFSGETAEYQAFMAVDFVDTNTGWAVGMDISTDYGVIFKTIDGGDTWTKQYDTAEAWGLMFYAVEFVNATTGWVAGYDRVSPGAAIILKTTDGGTNWTSQYSTAGRVISSLSFIDENIGWAGAYATSNSTVYVLKTIDGGSTWTTQYTNTDTTYIRAMQFVDSSRGWIAGYNNSTISGFVFNTTDGGDNWIRQYTGYSDYIMSLYIDSTDLVGYAVGNYSATVRSECEIIKYTDTVPITWYFAEGCTNGYDEWISIYNPNTTQITQITATLCNEDGVLTADSFEILPNRRYSFNVNTVVENDNVSAKIRSTNGVGIFAERSMYWDAGGITSAGGHCAKGSNNLNAEWYFAEGCTQGFTTWIAIFNPDVNNTANITVTFMKEDGTTEQATLTVNPNCRASLNVNTVVPNSSFSSKVQSTNNVNIVAEQSMYWDAGGMTRAGGHCYEGNNPSAPVFRTIE